MCKKSLTFLAWYFPFFCTVPWFSPPVSPSVCWGGSFSQPRPSPPHGSALCRPLSGSTGRDTESAAETPVNKVWINFLSLLWQMVQNQAKCYSEHLTWLMRFFLSSSSDMLSVAKTSHRLTALVCSTSSMVNCSRASSSWPRMLVWPNFISL